MSTISDALKKAQKQRQGGLPEPAPALPPEPHHDIGARHSHLAPVPKHPSGKPSFILILICVSVVTSVVVFYCLRGADRLRQGYGGQGSQKSASFPEATAAREVGSPSVGEPLTNSQIAKVAVEKLPVVQPEVPVNAAKSDGREVPARPEVPIVASKPEIANSNPATHASLPVEVAVSQPRTSEPVVSQPAPSKVPRADIPILGGTFYSEKNPVAIINGSAMKEGETIGAYQVVKILPYSVKLKCDGEDVEIRLK